MSDEAECDRGEEPCRPDGYGLCSTHPTCEQVSNAIREERLKNISERVELKKEVEKLRGALKPFADQAAIIDENDTLDGSVRKGDSRSFRFQDSYAAITLGDCRRAMEALK